MTQIHDDQHYMRLALTAAQQAYELGEVPIGAVLVWRDEVISSEHNRVEALSDPTAHAELLLISSVTSALDAKYLPECRLYVTVEPCPMCAGAIRWSRIGEVIYGAAEEKFGYRVFSPDIIPGRCRIRGGVLADEARALMQSFFRSRR